MDKVKAPFRFDGHGVNDAEGQRICKVSSCDPYIYPDGGPVRNPEFDRLSNLFAASADMYKALEEIESVFQGLQLDNAASAALLRGWNAIRKAQGKNV